MDNLMNKIVEKISAQDIIKANSQAEAKEAERIKLEAEQYRLQLEQLKVESEEFRNYLAEMRNDTKEYKAQLDEMRNDSRDYRKKLEEMRDEARDYREKLEENDARIHDVGVQVYRNVQAIVEKGQLKNKEEFSEVLKKLETLQVSVENKNNALLPVAVITMLLVIADIVINVLRILQVL